MALELWTNLNVQKHAHSWDFDFQKENWKLVIHVTKMEEECVTKMPLPDLKLQWYVEWKVNIYKSGIWWYDMMTNLQ